MNSGKPLKKIHVATFRNIQYVCTRRIEKIPHGCTTRWARSRLPNNKVDFFQIFSGKFAFDQSDCPKDNSNHSGVYIHNFMTSNAMGGSEKAVIVVS